MRPFLTSFYPNFSPLCSPCFQLQHSFYQKHYHNFPPPSAAHAFNYIPFIKNIPFIKIFPPSAAHAFNDSGYQVSSATLPDFLLSKFCPPSAAHAFNYNIPFIKNIPFITIFPPSAAHAFNDTRYQGSFATLPDFLLSKFFSPLQPMLSTTTFLLSKTFLLSQFSPPLQPMLSTTFLLSKTYSTCHAKRTWGHRVLLGGRVTSAPATQNGNRVTRNFPEASKILHLPHKKKVGSSLSPMICTCHTKRRWNHKKCSEASKNIAPATQRERIGSRRTARRQGRNLPQNGTSVTGNFSQCHGGLLGGV